MSATRGPARAEERMLWLLRRMTTPFSAGFIVAWDTGTVDDFVKAFPEAEKTLVVYVMGPNSSPLLNAAAGRAKKRLYVEAGTIGNEEARTYSQRTWCRTWKITDAGRAYLARQNRRKP